MSSTKNRYTLFIVAALAIILVFLDPFGLFKPSTKPPLASMEPNFASEIALDLKFMASEPLASFVDIFKQNPLVLFGYTTTRFALADETKNFLIAALPALSKAGVQNIVASFLLQSTQSEIDKLLSSPSFDERAAKSIILKSSVTNQFAGNLDLLRALWSFNNKNKDTPFTLWASATPEKMKYSTISILADQFEDFKKVINQDLITKSSLDIIKAEILGKNQKALVLENELSVISKFKVAVYDQLNEILGKELKSLGQVLTETYPKEVKSVIVYAPWPSRQKGQSFSYPFGSLIDSSLAKTPADDRVKIPYFLELQKTKVGLQFVEGTIYNYSDKIDLQSSQGVHYVAKERQTNSILVKDFADYLIILNNIQNMKFSAPMLVDESTIQFYRDQIPQFDQIFPSIDALNKQNTEFMATINKNLADFGY